MRAQALQAETPSGERQAGKPTRSEGTAAYDVAFEDDRRGTEWDAFVAAAAGGHHAQSSVWATVKGTLGWRAVRLVARDRGRIVGGAQVLVRDVGPFGRVGTCPRGPLLSRPDPQLADLLHDGLLELSRAERIRYLKVQPPPSPAVLEPRLRSRGWTRSALPAAPTATVRIDLRVPEEEILARMRPSVRNKIRQAKRRGLRLREGGPDDFSDYHRVVEATGRRQGFAPYPRRYYEALWETFAERSGACLMLAELDGRVLSATLVLAFGDEATVKMSGWSGERAPIRPNEAIHFAGMCWAKRIGADYYDFDGMERTAAVAVLRDGELPKNAHGTVTQFKLGFGGDVVLLPEALDIAPNRLLRPLVRAAAPRLDRVQRLAHSLAGRGPEQGG